MTLYRVADWQDIYESGYSRKRRELNWCRLPNKQDGLGYALIMQEPDGPSIYGAFVAMVLRLSRHQTREGYLTDNCCSDGRPLTAAELAVSVRFPTAVMKRMLEICSRPDIGWLQQCSPEPDTSPDDQTKQQTVEQTGITEQTDSTFEPSANAFEPHSNAFERPGIPLKSQKPKKEKPKIKNRSVSPSSMPDPGPESDSARLFSHQDFEGIVAACGWSEAADLAKAATTAGQQLERFAAMLWTKRQCDNPAGAAIAAFRRGWAPSDDGMAVVKAILRPPGKRRKPEPRRDPKRSDEYARARILFQRHRDLLRQHGIECVEGLLASPLYRELAQGVA